MIAIGCLRLSTDPARDADRAIDVLHAAFDAGITLVDTADAYCLEASEAGHNERLIARALATWNGDRSRIVVATKGGLTRPNGEWVASGRARHLRDACDASCRALGVERIALYQLHAPDPRVPLSTSVRALDALKRDGRIGQIGLCNVTVGQIEEARRITTIDAVQVELSIWQDGSFLNGVAEYCVEHGIRLLAYRPLGGRERRRRTHADPDLNAVAARHAATPFEIALAWLADLSDLFVALPGPTRVETVQSIARAREIQLSDEDRAVLDARCPAGRALRLRETRTARAPQRAQGDVVLIMGLPGAGKSTVAGTLVAEGYERLNRDEAGGSLKDLLPALDRLISSGASRIVLDNTYVSRTSRATLVEAAWKRGLAVRCVWLSTSVEDAQVNAVTRIVSRHGRLLTPEEMKKLSKRDVAAFGPNVQFRYQRELEPPSLDEGFSRVDVVPFQRVFDPTFANRALILWCDDVLRRGRAGEAFVERGEMLRRYQADGWRLLGLSWQPELAESIGSVADVEAAFARMQEQLGVSIEIEYCPHGAGPPICWCRKPLPGLGVVFIQRHRLDPAQCLYVGAGAQDPGFARRLGFQYRSAGEFFADAESGE